MKPKERENIKAERKRKRIEIRGFLLKKLSDFAGSFKERLNNEITVKSISPEEKEKIECSIEITSFEIECVSKGIGDYLRKCDAEENIHLFNKKKAR